MYCILIVAFLLPTLAPAENRPRSPQQKSPNPSNSWQQQFREREQATRSFCWTRCRRNSTRPSSRPAWRRALPGKPNRGTTSRAQRSGSSANPPGSIAGRFSWTRWSCTASKRQPAGGLSPTWRTRSPPAPTSWAAARNPKANWNGLPLVTDSLRCTERPPGWRSTARTSGTDLIAW